VSYLTLDEAHLKEKASQGPVSSTNEVKALQRAIHEVQRVLSIIIEDIARLTTDLLSPNKRTAFTVCKLFKETLEENLALLQSALSMAEA
jgi:hypothetical protein